MQCMLHSLLMYDGAFEVLTESYSTLSSGGSLVYGISTNNLSSFSMTVLSWRCGFYFHNLASGVGTTGAPGAGTPVKVFISRACPYTMCSFITSTSIALSCSAGTDGTETDIFFLLPTNFFSHGECFFLFRGKHIIENSDVCQWLVLVSYIQNHSAITQLFYVMTSLSLMLLASAWPFM